MKLLKKMLSWLYPERVNCIADLKNELRGEI